MRCIITSMEPPSSAQKPIRITKLPVSIEENPRLLNGLLRFPTESYKSDLGPMKGAASFSRNTVSMFRPTATRGDEEGEEEEERRKREIEVVNLELKCRRLRHRLFKLEMPVVRGPKSTKTYKSNELFFTLNFNNYQGTFTLLTGMYDLRNEPMRKKEVPLAQRIEQQNAMTDGRRKENPLGVANLKNEQQEDQ